MESLTLNTSAGPQSWLDSPEVPQPECDRPRTETRLLTHKPGLYVLGWVAVLDFFGGSRGFLLNCHQLWFKAGWGGLGDSPSKQP